MVVLAYSYIRFSSKEQAKGDSLRRQLQLAEAYCARRGWKLDTKMRIADFGVSAFRGDNALTGNLGVFLQAIAAGKVKPGSVLIVESIDRISRQGIDEGYDVIKKILKAGIILVTLSPEREFDVSAVKSLSKGALEIQLILERAAEESERKSERIKAAWVGKRTKLRNGEAVLTKDSYHPAWCTVTKEGKLEVVPARAEVLHNIFAMAAAGYGHPAIVRRLRQQGILPFPRRSTRTHKPAWCTSYINVLLNDRRVLGEYQPRDRHHQPDGPAILGFFPQVISEEEFQAARAGQQQRSRSHFRGRQAAHVNLFAGLVQDARVLHDPETGEVQFSGSYFATKRNDEGGERYILINYASTQKRDKCYAFNLAVFERAILQELKELNPSDVLPPDEREAPDTVLKLSEQLTRLEQSIAWLQQEMENYETPIASALQSLAKWEAKRAKLAAELAEARAVAAQPLAESWGEAKSLLGLLEADNSQETRLRLQAALRRIISEIRLLVVPRGRTRLAFAQIWFSDNRRDESTHYRLLRIIHRPTFATNRVHKEGRWYCDSLLQPKATYGGIPLDCYDLRDVDEARMALSNLETLPQEMVDRWLAEEGQPLPRDREGK